jgi:hypothetical protein
LRAPVLTNTRTHTHAGLTIDTYKHAYIHTYKHAYIHTYKHAYIHTYKHAYIHAYKLVLFAGDCAQLYTQTHV